MRVILTEDVEKLGDAGEVVRVKAGFARNYLLPQGKAMLATDGRVKEIEHKQRMVDEKLRKQVGEFTAVAKGLADMELEFERQAGPEGKLFGSVTNADIQALLKERGFKVERRRITLSEPIKQLGDTTVDIRLHRDVSATVKIKVIGGEPEPEPEVEEAAFEAIGEGIADEDMERH
jgi:large subunit ribosomal protein L9